jgi:hypothetical protein
MSVVQRLLAVSLLGLCATFFAQSEASAKSYKCEPGAIKAKKDYVVAQFQQYVAGKYKGTGKLGPVLLKIWDGNGDCDTSTDAPSKLSQDAMLNLVLLHYYGDIMTASADVAANKMADARPYLDDYKQVHGLIVGNMKPAFNADFFSQDKEMNSEMRDLDTQIAKAGFKTKVSDKI